MAKQEAKIFIGGLSWETTDEKLRYYFENFGVVQEAFVSYDRHTGRPRGFGFVVFADPAVADRVVSQTHTIDRREVEAKKALPKEDSPVSKEGAGSNPAAASPGPGAGPGAAPAFSPRTRKVFVGGLAASVDEAAFRAFFSTYGAVEDAVVMYDHENRRPRGFGFVTYADEASVDRLLADGPLHAVQGKPVEVKRAVPRDAMPPSPRGGPFRGPPAAAAAAAQDAAAARAALERGAGYGLASARAYAAAAAVAAAASAGQLGPYLSGGGAGGQPVSPTPYAAAASSLLSLPLTGVGAPPHPASYGLQPALPPSPTGLPSEAAMLHQHLLMLSGRQDSGGSDLMGSLGSLPSPLKAANPGPAGRCTPPPMEALGAARPGGLGDLASLQARVASLTRRVPAGPLRDVHSASPGLGGGGGGGGGGLASAATIWS